MSTVLDTAFAAFKGTAADWEAEAERRRKLTKVDPVADVLEYCASELRDQVKEIETDTHWLTVDQYAALHGKAPQTVRGWIGNKLIQWAASPDGPKIPRGARRSLACRTSTAGAPTGSGAHRWTRRRSPASAWRG